MEGVYFDKVRPIDGNALRKEWIFGRVEKEVIDDAPTLDVITNDDYENKILEVRKNIETELKEEYNKKFEAIKNVVNSLHCKDNENYDIETINASVDNALYQIDNIINGDEVSKACNASYEAMQATIKKAFDVITEGLKKDSNFTNMMNK